MKILVTGGTGFIGSHLSNQLAREGHEVTALDNLSNSLRDSITSEVQFLLADITDPINLRTAIGENEFDCVIHCAAVTEAASSEKQSDLIHTTNVIGTSNIVDLCSEKEIRHFIFSSSAAVYGNTDQAPIKETAPGKPINSYGKSKLAAENLLLHKAADVLKLCILRYFNVVGPSNTASGTDRSSKALLPSLYKAKDSTERVFTIYGNQHPTSDGTCVRDFIHIDDLVAAHMALINRLSELQTPLILNCGTGQGLSVLEIFNYFNAQNNHSLKLILAEARREDPHYSVADICAITSALDWSPKRVGYRIF